MSPASIEPVAHDLNPLATPGRARLPRVLLPLPWLLIAVAVLAGADTVRCLLESRSLSARERQLELRSSAAEVRASELREELRGLEASSARASALASWVTSGAHMQALIVDTLRVLPPGIPAHRIGIQFPDLSQQAEVVIDLGASPEAAAGALARIEAAWTDAGIRVSAREAGAGDERRRVHRLTLNLPVSGRIP